MKENFAYFVICMSNMESLQSTIAKGFFNLSEVAGSKFARTTTQGLKFLRGKCSLCNDMRKWLDFQVFSDKEDKP